MRGTVGGVFFSFVPLDREGEKYTELMVQEKIDDIKRGVNYFFIITNKNLVDVTTECLFMA